MRLRRDTWLGCVLFLIAGIATGYAQTGETIAPAPVSTATIAPSTQDALHTMAQMAAVIFAGRVVAIRQAQRACGVVEIDFAVEDAIRGVSGGTYTLREWAGLWAAGNEPFHVEQRYLMLLHAPGRSRLSSPVGGTDGAIPIAGGSRPGSADGRVVDLGWIQTRVPRTVSYADSPMALRASQASAVRANVRGAQTDVTLGTPSASAIEHGAAYSSVIGVLRDWERHAAR